VTSLPHGFEPVERGKEPDGFPTSDEVLRIEIVDLGGNVRPWEWSDMPIAWHEAIGWRIADDGVAQACGGCGRLTRIGFYEGPSDARVFNPLCGDCDADGLDC
jgi:MoaA/NifB/PqqE/SkfB family radical SAM enzyme